MDKGNGNINYNKDKEKTTVSRTSRRETDISGTQTLSLWQFKKAMFSITISNKIFLSYKHIAIPSRVEITFYFSFMDISIAD